MALSEIDKNLLERCLERKPKAWEDFVDRFIALVVHVVNHTAESRSIRLNDQDREDFAAEIFLTIVDDDFAILRRFQGSSSLATYLTVIARRIAVKQLLSRKSPMVISDMARRTELADAKAEGAERRIENREEVDRLLRGLNDKEADVVRMYHLEGKSYDEISSLAGVPKNSVGPTLSRARAKLSQASVDSPAG